MTTTTTKRYLIEKSRDGLGGQFVGGDGQPKSLTWEFDAFSEALAWLHQTQGGRGSVIDRETKQAYSPDLGWYDCAEYLAQCEE